MCLWDLGLGILKAFSFKYSRIKPWVFDFLKLGSWPWKHSEIRVFGFKAVYEYDVVLWDLGFGANWDSGLGYSSTLGVGSRLSEDSGIMVLRFAAFWDSGLRC